MKNRKWLKRKYPKSFEIMNEFLNDAQLKEFKKHKYRFGKLIKDVWSVDLYKKGCLIIFKRSNPINDMNYPLHYAITKCDENLTASGYQSIALYNGDFKEIFK